MLSIPNIVFIIPYRDREIHKNLFLEHYNNTKKYYNWHDNYSEIYFIHQQDKHPFNRGAMKNIGFIFIKTKYPDNYKNITIVFNDVDTYPNIPELIDYETEEGIVKHYYGYNWALGGILSIKAGDFEKIKGFPNLWGWGLEDNELNNRCKNVLKIDRSNFFNINDKRITRLNDGLIRNKSNRETYIYKYERNLLDDLTKINDIVYYEKGIFVNVLNFKIKRIYNNNELSNYDIRKGNKIKLLKGFYRKSWGMF